MAVGQADMRDAQWRAERRRELILAQAQVEQRTLVANVVGTMVIGCAGLALPNAADFHIPIVLRLVAIVATALLYDWIRARLARGEAGVPIVPSAIVVAFGGFSWATMLLPILWEPHIHVATLMVIAGVFIAVALVATATSSVPFMAAWFCAGFLATGLAGLVYVAPDHRAGMAGALVIAIVAIAIYGIGAANQRLHAADTLIEKRRLGKELAEALARAEYLSAHDPLTGLYNRRALFEDRIVDAARHERGHILLIDLDRFKRLNDLFGHETGDRVLVEVAGVFRDVLRGAGNRRDGTRHYAVRLGGEEFALFLDLPDHANAVAVAEDIRRAVADLASELRLPPGSTGVSIGIAKFRRGDDIGKAIHRADAAMYGAKTSGRNRVRCEDEAQAAPPPKLRRERRIGGFL